MNLGKLVFAQITQYLPLTTFRRCVARYGGGHKVKSFSCLDHYLCMAFAQLTYRESLRDIEACLRAQASKLYHMGIKSRVLSTSWTEATSTSSGFINCTRRKASLSPAPNRTSKPNVAIRTRSIEARG